MNQQFVAQLAAAGYDRDQGLEAAYRSAAIEKGLGDNGTYVVQGCYRKGLVTLMFEQNQALDESGDGLSVLVSYPAVCVVDGPNGKVACAASDLELILQLAGAAG